MASSLSDMEWIFGGYFNMMEQEGDICGGISYVINGS